MALILNPCQDIQLADCSVFTVTDLTGTYDLDDNPGGYETPNASRASLALYLFGYKYESDSSTSDTSITSVINNADPSNVTYWEIANSEDGYYYFDLIAANIWDSVVTYAIDEIVFNAQVWYKALAESLDSEPTSVNTDWEIITDLEAEKDNTSLVATIRYDMNYTCRIETCYALVVKEAGAVCGCQDCGADQILQLYQKLDVLLQSMFVNMAQENWIEADSIAETMIGYCKKTNCRVC